MAEQISRLNAARSAGVTVEGTLLTRRGLGCLVTEGADGLPVLNETGLLVHGKDIARLVHGGYQMYFVTRDEHRMAALADHLKALHSFTEDLAAAVGSTSMYNTGLGDGLYGAFV